MFDYAGGPAPHLGKARTIIATIGLGAFPEGAHRDRMTALVVGGPNATVLDAGTEAVFALVRDEDAGLTSEQHDQMIEALGELSRAALGWSLHGKADRWLAIQMWAWAAHSGDEPSSAPEVDPALLTESPGA